MNALLTHPFIAALATTLLHSTWMFVVLIGLGWWSARALAEARHRYLAYLLSLLTLPLVFGAVLFMEWRTRADAWSAAELLRDSLGADATLELTGNLSKLGIASQANWISYLAVAYLLGLLVSLAISTYRYRATVIMRRSGWPAPPEFRALFERLRKELVPGRRVDWKISKRVAGAVATGVLRPVILFPVGLINALSPDEVEAILRHELTHLLRRDPVWNAVQEIVVSLFFYHPLVYFLTRWLNREREFACDDAVSQTTGRTIYARALVRAAKFSLHPSPPFTMAATNNRHFSTRIQRLFSPAADAQGSGAPSRSFLLAPLAIVPIFFLFAFAPGNADRQEWTSAETSVTSSNLERVVEGTITDCDTGDPLIGTAIAVEGTEIGTITDFSGNYKLRVPAGKQAITYSYVGYETVRLPATFSNNLHADIAMCKDKDGKVTLREGDKRISFEAEEINAPKTSVLSAMGTKLLIIVDGKRHTSGSVDDISPDTIQAVEVIKDMEKIEALGYGTDFKGAIIITSKQ